MFDKEHSKEQGLFFNNRQMSWILSGFILISFFTFMSGYFLGQKKGVEKFTQKMEQESLSDHIYSSMCALYENDDTATADLEGSDTSIEQELENQEKDSDTAALAENEADETEDGNEGPFYYAQLVGFGSQKNAEKFREKLAAKGIEVKIHKHQSKTAKGKITYWYQVVTGDYANKRELEDLVYRLKIEEKIHDVRIITC